MNLEQILNYIKENGLDSKSRYQSNVYRRHYLINKLYKTGKFTTIHLGYIFKRDHSTIINSLRKHEELKQDKFYQNIVQEAANMFNDSQFDIEKVKRNIYDDVAKATNLEKLRRVRRWIKEGKYQTQN